MELEKVCTTCKGEGEVLSADPGFFAAVFGIITKRCESCGGKGYILTTEGRQMVQFMIRHVTTGFDGGGLHPR